MELYEWHSALLKRMQQAGCGNAASMMKKELLGAGEYRPYDPLLDAMIRTIDEDGFRLFLHHVILGKPMECLAAEWGTSKDLLDRRLDSSLRRAFREQGITG